MLKYPPKFKEDTRKSIQFRSDGQRRLIRKRISPITEEGKKKTCVSGHSEKRKGFWFCRRE